MNTKQGVALGLRLFALWLCVGAFQVFSVLSIIRSARNLTSSASWVMFLVVVGLLAVASIVWLASSALARALTHGFKRQVVERITSFQLVAVGCILMGLWWIKTALIPLISLCVRAYMIRQQNGQSMDPMLSEQFWLESTMNGVQVLAGVGFVVGAGKIARWTLRGVLRLSEVPVEPIRNLLRQATELGLRQAPTKPVIRRLSREISDHPDIGRYFQEVIELLGFAANAATRQVAVHTVLLLGPGAAQKSREAAVDQLGHEDEQDVRDELEALIALADQRTSAEAGMS